MKILNIDIETRPALAYIWDLRTRYVPPGNVVEPKSLLCFAAKWVGSDRIFFYSTWHDGREKVVSQLHSLLSEADAVLTYNGDRFDIPTINTEFILAGLPPVSPNKSIDLYKTVRKEFAFMSKSLDFTTRSLGTSKKIETGGMGLWLGVMRGDKDAQVLMRKYNIADIYANEALYLRILPWIRNHPSHAVMTGEHVCPNCAGRDLSREGYAHTKTRTYQRYRCRACGKWSRDSRSLDGVGITEV